MSPEQAVGREDLDARSDIYSLGAVAYFLLVSQPPFVRTTAIQTVAAHMLDPVVGLNYLRSDMQPILNKSSCGASQKNRPNASRALNIWSEHCKILVWPTSGLKSMHVLGGNPKLVRKEVRALRNSICWPDDQAVCQPSGLMPSVGRHTEPNCHRAELWFESTELPRSD